MLILKKVVFFLNELGLSVVLRALSVNKFLLSKKPLTAYTVKAAV